MDREEIKKELKMTYYELQDYLIQKYGPAKYDYFATPECKTKNSKVSRTSEGLYCHHMDEDKGGNLSSSTSAKSQTFEWQKKERLLYCNIIEHLILHIKIAVLRQKEPLKTPQDVFDFFTTGGIFMLCYEINDMFVCNGTSVAWRKRCFDEVSENYNDYIDLLKTIFAYIDDSYVGNKEEPALIVQGSIIHFDNCECEIVRIIKEERACIIKHPSGENEKINISLIDRQFRYLDRIEDIRIMMSFGYGGFYEAIYNDIGRCDNVDDIEEYMKSIKVDYVGYGYAQYANIELTEDFGSKNADEYISKALPMYSDAAIQLEGKNPRFWKGSDIPQEVEHSFFIIRIETMFNVKDGFEPFVRYREFDWMRLYKIGWLDDTHNLKTRNCMVLSTSDAYDSSRSRYFSKYIDFNGNLRDATVILTLGREDYQLFRERYDIRYLKILDGCYFC